MCTEGMIISKIMRSLTSEFNPFVDHYHFFRDTDPGTLDLAQMTARLLTFESDVQQRKAAKTLMTLAYNGKAKGDMKCDTCNKKGHTKDRCWQTYPHLKKIPQELQAVRTSTNKPKYELNKIGTPRKVLAMTTTDLKQFNKHLSNESYDTYNKSEYPLYTSIKTPRHRCKTLSSDLANTNIDSETQKSNRLFVSGGEEEGVCNGGRGNTGLEGISGVQGIIPCPSHSLLNGKGVNFRSCDDFEPQSLNPVCNMLLETDSAAVE